MMNPYSLKIKDINHVLFISKQSIKLFLNLQKIKLHCIIVHEEPGPLELFQNFQTAFATNYTFGVHSSSFPNYPLEYH